jgi:GDP-D-mannose 3',5'-epimerase
MSATEDKRVRVCIAGGAGFIGSHLARRLMCEGYWVRCVDWAANIYFKEEAYCNEFVLGDLRDARVCADAVRNCDWVFNMAADMGGMGFIESNGATLMHNNALIDTQLIEAARRAGAVRYFYASSACVYPADLQTQTASVDLIESMAGRGEPYDDYGFEKRWGERLALAYGRDFAPVMAVRIGRFHNIYGPHGTWRGGREKVPAAFCRKALTSETDFEVWGDGKQTRSFCYIDDCIEGVLRLMRSDCAVPLNIGSDHLISMNDLAKLALSLVNKNDLPLRHVKGPMGVRGRNSDNTLVRRKLGWAPSIALEDGMQHTMNFIAAMLQQEVGADPDKRREYAESRVVDMRTPEQGGGRTGVRE